MKEKGLEGSLDDKIAQTEYIKQKSWGKLLNYLKRQFDHWTTTQLINNGYKHFKLAHLPVLMNIAIDGINNNELAKRARVSKQAMSKVLKELSEYGYVKTKVDPTDKRSSQVMLTDKGKRFVIDARMCVKSLMDDYRKEFGKEAFDQHLDFMLRIVEFNDKRMQEEKE